jgi:hypothetical protein
MASHLRAELTHAASAYAELLAMLLRDVVLVVFHRA